jgi:hypothetical protein
VPEDGREGELDPGPGPRVGQLQGQELVTRHWGNLHLEETSCYIKRIFWIIDKLQIQ